MPLHSLRSLPGGISRSPELAASRRLLKAWNLSLVSRIQPTLAKHILAAAQTKPFVYESVWNWLNITENGCKVSTKTRPLFASKLPKLEGLRPRRKDRTKKPLPPLLNLWFTTKFIKFIVIRAFLNSKGLFPGWGITMYTGLTAKGFATELVTDPEQRARDKQIMAISVCSKVDSKTPKEPRRSTQPEPRISVVCVSIGGSHRANLLKSCTKWA